MFEDTQVFISVVETGGFSKAAKKLGYSTPVVTRRIARLEQELGVRLLQRNTRHVSLTEAGTIFHESCRELLQNYAASIKQVKNLTNNLVGTLKIGLPSAISHLHITRNLNDFLCKHPDLRVHIVNGNHLFDLLSSGFDLIVHCGELPNTNYYYKKLGDWTKVTCASPDYLKHHGTPKTPEDLAAHNCLDHYDNSNNTWKYIVENKQHLIPVCGTIRINSSMDLKNLAVAGMGIVYLPSFVMKQELAAGKLKSILQEYQPSPLGMYVVYPSKHFLNTKTKLFIDFLLSLTMTD